MNEIRCNLVSPEASFEAIRGILPPDNGAFFTKLCNKADCRLTWRQNAVRFGFFVNICNGRNQNIEQ
jgi:hypothetical protein